MAGKSRYTDEQRAQAARTYPEIGESLARLVLEHGKSETEAWALIADLGLYHRWELSIWLITYRHQRRSRLWQLRLKQRRRNEMAKQLEAAKPRKLSKALRKSTDG